MSVGWESLPLLPLRCILQHLPLEDALAATSACQHWRHALLVYEGHRETMTLRTKETEKNLFLARIFRKHVQKLHVHIDCADQKLDKFFNIVLPEYFYSAKLKEIQFIGPTYLQQNRSLSIPKLRRIVTESLIFKNAQSLTQLSILGCEMDVANDNDRYMHEQIEYYSAPLTFSPVQTAGDRLLSSTNSSLMVFSTLQHISLDYENLSTETLATLSALGSFRHLSMSVRARPARALHWESIRPLYPNGLDVSVNIIALPYRWFKPVMEYVLVEGLSLVALRVFFAQTMHCSLLQHLARYHKSSLRELVWVDAPFDAIDPDQRLVPSYDEADIDTCNINPFILICWQCVNLRKLVIHGYWVWQYDILGFVRLRKSLRRLEVGAVCAAQGRHAARHDPNQPVRVLAGDSPRPVDKHFIRQVNEFTEFEWSPVSWKALHPALLARGSPAQRADYARHHIHAATD